MLSWITDCKRLKQRVARLEMLVLFGSTSHLFSTGYCELSDAINSKPRVPHQRVRKRSRRSLWPHYIVTSLFLRHCYPHLMKDEAEVVSYVSGPQVNNARILDHVIPFELSHRDLCHARGDIVSSTNALITLCNRGYCLHGTVHSHPGSGESATTPSLKDLTYHRRLEQGGYQAVGIIMTRDGYVRFFSSEMPFTLKVVGKDIVKLGHNSYRLSLNHGANSQI